MLISIPLLVLMVEGVNPRERRLPQSFFVSIVTLAVLCAVLWLSLRGRYISRAKRALASDSHDQRALKKWQAGHLISFILSEAVVLYGVNLRFRGLTFTQATPFYVAGILLMIFSAPGTPETQTER